MSLCSKDIPSFILQMFMGHPLCIECGEQQGELGTFLPSRILQADGEEDRPGGLLLGPEF